MVELRYDRILDAVAAGEVDAGLIIHESRFTYAEHGLVSVADLGEWWEGDTGLPVPLAGIFARTDLEPELVGEAEAAIRASVEYAFANPEASRAYVRSLSHEMSDEVCVAHIALYVNASSVDIGDEGMAAIDRLLGRAAAAARLLAVVTSTAPMSRAVVLSAVRTPIGRYGGALSGVRPDDLAALVIREAVARAGVPPERSRTSGSAPPTRRARTTATSRGWPRCSRGCRNPRPASPSTGSARPGWPPSSAPAMR